MSTIELAAIVVAGTVLVAAPIDPRALRNPCRRHPDVPSADGKCRACTQEEADRIRAEHVRGEAELSAKVRKALGMPGYPAPCGDETARRVCMWSQYELNAVYERVGGAVTSRTVRRSTHGGESTWDATEITVTVDLPDVGRVEVVTDWYEEYGGRDLPLMQAIPDAELIAT